MVAVSASHPREGWWEAVGAGEAVTVTARFTGAGSFGLLVGDSGGAPWVVNRGITGDRSLSVTLPPVARAGVWRVQVSRYTGAAEVAVTVTSTQLPKGSDVPLYRLKYGIGNLPAGSVVQRRGQAVTVTPRALNNGLWQVQGTQVVDGLGVPYKLRGANIGVNGAIGGTVSGDQAVSANTTEAVQWGWNTVRFNMYCSTQTPWIAQYGRDLAISKTFQAAQRYLDAGFIVMLAPMDQTAGNRPQSSSAVDDMVDFAAQAGERFKADSRVWFNVNEPVGVEGGTFVAYHDRLYQAWRSTGNQSIYVADVLTNAQDAVFGGRPKAFEVGPQLLTGRSNIMFGLHNYGGQAQNAHTQDTFNGIYNTYAANMAAAGLAFGTFEAGYRVDGKDQAGGTSDVNRNVRGFRASLQQSGSVGVLAWHGTFDAFTLKAAMKDQYNGQPFWFEGAETGLSPMGREFWDWCHQ